MANAIYIILVSLLALLTFPAHAQTITRGPYLQSLTTESVVIRWRTGTAQVNEVVYGTTKEALNKSVQESSAVMDHEIKISGLLPGTIYYYAIKDLSNVVLRGGNDRHFFKTAPAPGAIEPIRIWAIGDFGKGDMRQVKVKQAYLDYTKDEHTDVWLWLGDNAYDDGTDNQYQDKVFDDTVGYRDIMSYMPFWPCPGNHDYNSVNRFSSPDDHNGPYFDIITVPTNGEAGGIASGTEVFYSFDYGNVHFISLNSEATHWTGAGALSVDHDPTKMSIWLENDLAATDKEWTIIYFHQPPYSKGSHDSDDFYEVLMRAMRENFVPIFDKYNVDLVINGHSHVFERSYLLHGHNRSSSSFDASTMIIDKSSGSMSKGEPYFKLKDRSVPKQGTVYYVVGNSGSNTGSPALNHPAMYTGWGCDTCWGSLVIDVSGDTLAANYLTSAGKVIDEVTIIKPSPVGISTDFAPISNLTAYPNPSNGEFTIEYFLKKSSDITVQLIDKLGRVIVSREYIQMTKGRKEININLNQGELSPGTYFIKVSSPQKTMGAMIVVAG